jgi:hypothetical protein
MNHQFNYAITPAFTELRLTGPAGQIDVDDWAIEGPGNLLAGVDLTSRLRAADAAVEEGPVLFVDHAAIAGLTAQEAGLIGLPPLTEAIASVSTRGQINRPDFTAELVWKRPTGQAIAGAERCGAWLRVGDDWRRLPDVLFDLAERIDQLNSAADLAGRMAAAAALSEALPAAEATGKADASGLIRTMTIAVADAFSLDLIGEGEASRLVPVLHRAGAEAEAPLLPDEQQRAFGEDQFHRFSTARSLYAIGGGTYVVLSPPLRSALAEVRRVQGESLATKRALLASPRAFLRQVLGEETDSAVIENLFRETPTWSDRVVGLGLWQTRVLPWIELPSNDWFGGMPDEGREPSRPPTRGRGLLLNDRTVALTAEQITQLHTATEAAIASGDPTVPFTSGGETFMLPATAETLVALSALEDANRASSPPPPTRPQAESATEVLVIRSNENIVDIEADWTPRGAHNARVPSCLRTALKAHQDEGLHWLQQAWLHGRPGVLLADDMGLGKTLQALTFLAWLREGMQAGRVAQGPLLIVAPTGLLENWREEHDRHLDSPGLGKVLCAYGKELALHRATGADGRPTISVAALRSADCVLTTYETLRDYDRDFGQVRFVAAVFDEAQKIKTPGIRLTDAAKAMNVEFRVAMTGTPVENRLADLWCIVDAVHPGYLGELKRFSARYERQADEAELRSLKDQLDRSRGDRPPLMVRRLRWDHLPDLPPCEENIREEVMPAPQHAAYDAAIERARDAGTRGAVLSALSALRRISLHPDAEGAEDDTNFINASARLIPLFRILDEVRDRHERALIFLDDRTVQARLAGVIQRRYRLPASPMIINGAVPGAVRQARVNRFQSAASEFDVMLLSPRAGGVGLTLTAANHAIHLERWWNPAVEDQCTGRVLRIGQSRPVTVHIVQALCHGRRSFDQNLHALLQRKRDIVRDTLGSGEVSDDESLTLLKETIS